MAAAIQQVHDATISRNRRIKFSILVGRRPVDWLFCRWQIETPRHQRRIATDARGRYTARWGVEFRRSYPFHSELLGSIIPDTGFGWDGSRSHEDRESGESPLSAVPTGRASVHLLRDGTCGNTGDLLRLARL